MTNMALLAFMFVMQEITTPKEAATEMSTAQPCVVVRGSLHDPKGAFLVVEKRY